MDRNLERKAQLKQISIVSFLTAILYFTVSFVDSYIAPKELVDVMLLAHRFINPLFILTISLLAFLEKQYYLMIFLLVIAPLVAATSNIIVVSSLDSYSIYAAEIYLIIFWIFTVSGLKFYYASVSATMVLIVSLIASYSFFNFSTQELVMHTFWILSAYVFGLTGSYLLHTTTKRTRLYQEELSVEINNKNILLRELFHRVKNNLQIITSILSMQSKKIQEPSAKDSITQSIQTLRSMSLIHENLYVSENLENVKIDEYISNLVNITQQTLNTQDIKFDVSCEQINLNLQDAVPIGLIINEVFTNSIKHAFDINDATKIIQVNASSSENMRLILEISDNGKGIDEKHFKEGFGLKLIDSLVKFQLKGELKISHSPSLHYIINLPL